MIYFFQLRSTFSIAIEFSNYDLLFQLRSTFSRSKNTEKGQLTSKSSKMANLGQKWSKNTEKGQLTSKIVN